MTREADQFQYPDLLWSGPNPKHLLLVSLFIVNGAVIYKLNILGNDLLRQFMSREVGKLRVSTSLQSTKPIWPLP